MYEISYSLDQLEAAANFIWNNNKRCKNWTHQCSSAKDVKKVILEDIRRVAAKNMANYDDIDKWTNSISTGGYMITFNSDNPNEINAEIFVDPNVGNRTFCYITEVYDDEE